MEITLAMEIAGHMVRIKVVIRTDVVDKSLTATKVVGIKVKIEAGTVAISKAIGGIELRGKEKGIG